jgi:quercetin dioxygenase-like cupin family protein
MQEDLRTLQLVRRADAPSFASEGIGIVQGIAHELGEAGRFWFGVFTSEAGLKVPPHYHEYEVAVCLVRGRAAFEAGGHRFELQPGDFFQVPRGLVHREETIGDEEAEFVFGHVGGTETVFVTED